jgi:dimethylhistidine N-methyltransferase
MENSEQTHSTSNESPLLHEAELFSGLFGGQSKSIPSIYFYDEVGSELFCQITETPEYYLKNKELGIIQNNAWQLATQVRHDTPLRIIELGAGSAEKSVHILKELSSTGMDLEYIPIDISPSALSKIEPEVERQCPDIKVNGIIGDNLACLKALVRDTSKKNLVLFLGSSIGNFRISESQNFLESLGNILQQDDLILIGFDLLKDPSIMQKAYSDDSGLTKEFNLNLLRRMNKELGSDFNVSRFHHHAYYNPWKHRMESYLISRIRQIVSFARWQKTLRLEEFEFIHTEISQKYTFTDIYRLADTARSSIACMWTDEDIWFCDALLRVR